MLGISHVNMADPGKLLLALNHSCCLSRHPYKYFKMLFLSSPSSWYLPLSPQTREKKQKKNNSLEQSVYCLWSNGSWRKPALPRYVRALAYTCASCCSHIPLLWNSGQKLCIPHLHSSSYSFYPLFSRPPKNEFTTLE